MLKHIVRIPHRTVSLLLIPEWKEKRGVQL